ncbi:hypothetical protein MRB53_042149 [Persea americana]|nr:hypothetical protein MRB53_042149 [Persea americana]
MYSSSPNTHAHSASEVNAPSTFPPDLERLPPRPPKEYRLKYAYRLGKTYLQFYKTGLHQVLDNRAKVARLRARHPELTKLDLHRGDYQSVFKSNQNGNITRMTRSDFQLIHRHSKDIKKLPAMALLLLILGEWLPLFVVFLDPLIPGTMLLPKQIEKRRRKQAQAKIPGTIDPKNIEGTGIHDRQTLANDSSTLWVDWRLQSVASHFNDYSKDTRSTIIPAGR